MQKAKLVTALCLQRYTKNVYMHNFVFVFYFIYYLFFFFLWVIDHRILYIIFSGGCVYTDSKICMQGETFQQQNSQLGT